MNSAFKKIKINLFIFLILILPSLSLAQVGIKNPIQAESLDGLILSIVKAVRMVAIPFIVLAIMWTGWKFILAQGNPEKLKGARNSFLWVFLGALILLSSELLAGVISNTIKNLQ